MYLDGARGGECLESQADLAAYVRAFEQFRAFALSPAQSALMLRSASVLRYERLAVAISSRSTFARAPEPEAT